MHSNCLLDIIIWKPKRHRKIIMTWIERHIICPQTCSISSSILLEDKPNFLVPSSESLVLPFLNFFLKFSFFEREGKSPHVCACTGGGGGTVRERERESFCFTVITLGFYSSLAHGCSTDAGVLAITSGIRAVGGKKGETHSFLPNQLSLKGISGSSQPIIFSYISLTTSSSEEDWETPIYIYFFNDFKKRI